MRDAFLMFRYIAYGYNTTLNIFGGAKMSEKRLNNTIYIMYLVTEHYKKVLVPGDFDHSGTGEKSQKVTRANDQKSHLTPLIIRFPEDCQKQFLPFL